MAFKTTIDTVLSDITKKIGQLRELAEKHSLKAEAHTASVEAHKIWATLETEARDKATRIASKFEDLLK